MARDLWEPSGRPLGRRAFLARSAGAALAMSGAGALLAACGKPQAPGQKAAGPPLASPENPVTWPIAADNQPIADGLEPERNAVLKLYNWTDYIYKKVAVDDFQKKYKQYGVKVQISTFNTMDEAIAKLRTGQVDFDLFFPTYDRLGKIVEAGLLRPLNHSYIPNIDQAWPVFKNPFYDQQWRYTVPYTVYTTGVAWRNDKVHDDVAKLSNPYEALWDERYRGRVGILDDYREAISMALLKNGITNLNTGDPKQIDVAKQDLLRLAKAVKPVVNVKDYVDLPEGRTWITQAWSGDMNNAQYYMPKGQDPGVIRYWFPPDGHGAVGSDLVSILRGGKNPVLAHHFLNYMLEFDVAMENLGWNGYQPPLNKATPAVMVNDEYIPKTLETTVVLPSDFDKGYRQLELSPEVDNLWNSAWQEFKAGA
jgi:spermidine/putrescine transport system substrate-binding protein